MYLSKVKVKEIMNDKGIMTFTDLANQLGITKYQLSVMLSDGYNPLKSGVEKLCNVFNISCFELFAFDHIKPREELLEEIFNDIVSFKSREKIETIYKIVKALKIE